MDRVKKLIHLERAYKMGYDGKNISVAVMEPMMITVMVRMYPALLQGAAEGQGFRMVYVPMQELRHRQEWLC